MFRPRAWDLPRSPLHPGCRVLGCQLPHSDKGTSSPEAWWKASLEGHQSMRGKPVLGTRQAKARVHGQVTFQASILPSEKCD